MSELQASSKVNQTRLQSLLFKGAIQELFNTIDQLIHFHGDDVLLEINKFFSRPFHLSVLLYHVLRSEDLMKQMLKESYYHENGFHKIVLASGSYFKLRLHHFGSGVKIPMENVHDHRWTFASSILVGSLKMDLFEVHEREGEQLIHYRYDSNKSSGRYQTTCLGRKFIRKTETRSFDAGEQYLMLPTDLHRIINQPGEESVTLILTGNPKGQTCNLYAKRALLEEEKKPLPYSFEDMACMLKNLSEKIYPTLN
jgi:hypothetical protein